MVSSSLGNETFTVKLLDRIVERLYNLLTKGWRGPFERPSSETIPKLTIGN